MRTGAVIGIVVGVLVVVVVGVGFAVKHVITSLTTHQPLAADQMALVGQWVDQTGDVLVIKADGEGDYTSPNVKVSGGDATINGDQLTVGMSFIKKQFTITRRPTATNPTLVLDGSIYKRDGAAPAISTPATSAPTPSAGAPAAGLSPENGSALNRDMTTALYKAVDADDATILSNAFAVAAQGQLSGPFLRDHFAVFFNKAFLPVLKSTLDNWPKTATVTPLTGADDGHFSVQDVVVLPNGQTFTISCKYFLENGAFKAYSINADLPAAPQAPQSSPAPQAPPPSPAAQTPQSSSDTDSTADAPTKTKRHAPQDTDDAGSKKDRGSSDEDEPQGKTKKSAPE